MKTIPDLIRVYGSIGEASRQSGIAEMTVSKYQNDVAGQFHVIHNNRLMVAHQNSRELFRSEVELKRKWVRRAK